MYVYMYVYMYIYVYIYTKHLCNLFKLSYTITHWYITHHIFNTITTTIPAYSQSPHAPFIHAASFLPEPDLSEVYLVRLSRCRVRNLGDVRHCYNLAVLDLSDNYVSSISSLSACCQLYKLDLSSNKVTCDQYCIVCTHDMYFSVYHRSC